MYPLGVRGHVLRRRTAAWAAGGLLLRTTAVSAEVPAICTEAILAHEGTRLEALAEAEQAQWRIARKADGEARRLMRSTVGMGTSDRSVEAAAKVAELTRRSEEALRTAWVLCSCREAAGDPHRRDCAAQYRRWIPPTAR